MGIKVLGIAKFLDVSTRAIHQLKICPSPKPVIILYNHANYLTPITGKAF